MKKILLALLMLLIIVFDGDFEDAYKAKEYKKQWYFIKNLLIKGMHGPNRILG